MKECKMNQTAIRIFNQLAHNDTIGSVPDRDSYKCVILEEVHGLKSSRTSSIVWCSLFFEISATQNTE